MKLGGFCLKKFCTFDSNVIKSACMTMFISVFRVGSFIAVLAALGHTHKMIGTLWKMMH